MSTSEDKPGRDPLLAAICHDLRAPLASVMMGAGFVLQSTPDDEENARQRRILHAMLRSCAQMERLVRNFADLSEIQSGALDLRLDEHDVREMLLLAAEGARELATSRRVELEVDAPEHETFACDRDRLLRAVGQLVDNAVRNAPAETAVTLSAAVTEREIVIRVRDQGTGPSSEALAALFEVHGKSRGLAIARGYAQAHGGTIALEPPATFVIKLPRRRLDRARPPR